MDVVICDDHRAFAESLAYVLKTEGINVIAVTSTPPDAYAAVEETPPDVCIMDVNFPEHDGIEATAELVGRYGCKVLLLTGATDAHTLSAALAAGASGFVHKAEEIPTIVRAVQRVAKGDVVVETPRLNEAADGPAARSATSRRLLELLTPRERDVLELIVRGIGTQDIADQIHVSYSTARTHTQSILTKLGVHSRLEAAAFAVGNRLVLPPPPPRGRD